MMKKAIKNKGLPDLNNPETLIHFADTLGKKLKKSNEHIDMLLKKSLARAWKYIVHA